MNHLEILLGKASLPMNRLITGLSLLILALAPAAHGMIHPEFRDGSASSIVAPAPDSAASSSVALALSCRNNPIDLTDPLGLDALVLDGQGKAYWAIEKDWWGPNPTVRKVEIGTWQDGVVRLSPSLGGNSLSIPELSAAAAQRYALKEADRSVIPEVNEDLQNEYVAAVLKAVSSGKFAPKSSGKEAAAAVLDMPLEMASSLANLVSLRRGFYCSPAEVRDYWGVLNERVNECSPVYLNTRQATDFVLLLSGLYGGIEAATAKSVAAKSGGRLGNDLTRSHINDVATEMESRGWEITRGGQRGLPEEYLPGPGGARKGSSYLDITATKNGRTLRVNTVDTYADGITPTTREAVNAARIRSQTPGEHLLLIPKPKP